jgi:hypothetical protein
VKLLLPQRSFSGRIKSYGNYEHMTDRGLIVISVKPAGRPAEGAVAGLASLLKKDIYETGMLLSGKAPKIVARLAGPGAAREMVSSLEKMGLQALAIEEAELQKPASYFKAHKISLETGAAGFENRAGISRKLESADVFLILKGRLSRRHVSEVETTTRKLNVSSTLLTGIPMLKKETRTVKEVTSETEVFLRLYRPQSMDPEVELLQHDIDYSFLGSQMTATSQGNFNLLSAKLREAFPCAIFDENLMEAPGADLVQSAGIDISTVNSRLLYLFYSDRDGDKAV